MNATATTEIVLTDPMTSTEMACEAHDGWPLHIASECGRLAGVRPYSKRITCSVCELEWGRGVTSQHEGCATLYDDGGRKYARPVVEYQRGDAWVTIR